MAPSFCSDVQSRGVDVNKRNETRFGHYMNRLVFYLSFISHILAYIKIICYIWVHYILFLVTFLLLTIQSSTTKKRKNQRGHKKQHCQRQRPNKKPRFSFSQSGLSISGNWGFISLTAHEWTARIWFFFMMHFRQWKSKGGESIFVFFCYNQKYVIRILL